MKRRWLLCILLCFTLFACGKKEAPPTVQMGNPWQSYATLEEAEAVAGFTLNLPNEIGDYTAQSFSVMNGELLQAVYQKDDTQITIRKQAGEGQDISGVYENFTRSESYDYFDGTFYQHYARDCHVMLVDRQGYSWSVYFPTAWQEEYDAFIDPIFER